jgi:galactokinase/mevalonate kinase-like predicted kinase
VAAARELEQSLLVVQLEAGGRKADVVGEVVTAVRMRDRSTLGALWRLQDLAHELFEAIDRASLDRLPRCMRSIREAQAALHAAVCCPVTAAALEAVRRKLPELEYKILGGGGAGSCVLIHIPPGDRLRAIELLEKYATRVLPVRIQSHGVRAEHLASLAASLS